ncbi:guanylate kinase [Armatimonadetes bacterium DC]|nr:guanylate kinase [Armatimonadetes bacterium DC]
MTERNPSLSKRPRHVGLTQETENGWGILNTSLLPIIDRGCPSLEREKTHAYLMPLPVPMRRAIFVRRCIVDWNTVLKPPTRGLLIVLSGPAGVGKDTLIEQWQLVAPNVRRLITYTTRPQTRMERHGLDYYFVTEEEFQQMIAQGAFLEYANVHGNWYGTPLHKMEELRNAGRDVVLRIDVQGAMQVREKFPEAVLIFVAPPSLEELERRLRKRGRDSEEAIQLRLENARREMEYIPKYDYVVVNDDINRALETLRCILIAERHRVRHRMETSVAESEARSA